MSTGSHTPRLPRALATAALRALGPICVAVIPVVTALIVWLGPDPSVPTGPSQLSASALQQSLHEPRDRVALVVWLLIVALITIAITSGVVRWLSSRRWIGDPRWVWATLPGMLLLGVGLLYPDDGFRVVPHIGPVEVVAGAVLAVAVVFITMRHIHARALANALMLVGMLALLVPVWVQLPGRLPDWYNARFTLTELAAPGAGATPLHDFFPAYTQLLGFPIAPLLRAFPSQAVGICLGWVLVLQAVALVVAVCVAAWAGGRRYIGPAAIVVPSLAFAAGPHQYSSFTYYAVNPLRTVLPIAAIAVACLALRNPALTTGRYWRALVMVGLVSGVALLNNPDFGGPAIIAVWLVAMIAAAGRRRTVIAAVVIPVAALAVFVLYTVVTAAAGVAPHWKDWLLFPRLYGPDGFYNLAMPATGWHVAGVTLFVTAAVIGVVLVRSARATAASRRRRQGLALALVGGWSVLTLPYYAGRSAVPTFLGGYSIQVGWTVACLLPLIAVGVRRRPWQRARMSATSRLSVVLGMVAVTACMAMLTQTASKDALSRDPSASLTTPPLPSLQAALAQAPPAVATALRRGQVVQAVEASTFVALEGGIRSVLVYAEPLTFALSDSFIYRQCQRLVDDPASFLVIQSADLPFFTGVPECARVLRLRAARPLVDPLGVVPDGFQAIPLR